MFGYVEPDKSELKVKELARYNAYYCGLCKAIGARYSAPARAALNFDCAFIAMLLCAVSGGGHCAQARCAFKPFAGKKLYILENEQLRFTAALNVLFAGFKLADNVRDERSIVSGAGRLALAGDTKKAAKDYPDLASFMTRSLDELTALERAKSKELDAAADIFGRFVRGLLAYAPVDCGRERAALGALAYNIGKWIYLADAWEDREKDGASGAYNPFLASGAGKERAEFLMNFSLNEAINAYGLITFRADKAILDNIIYFGCPSKCRSLTGETV